jgi:chromosomal replication initiator protein
MDISIQPTELISANVLPESNHLAQRVWSECLKLLKNKTNTQSYKTWFEPIIPLEFDSGTLKVELPSLFFYEWLEEHYSALLYEAIKNIVGENSRIEFSINKETVNLEKLIDLTSSELAQGLQKKNPVSGVKNTGQGVYNANIQVKDSNVYKLNHSALNRKHTFDNFIKGESNQLARAAALAVANNPGGTQFNPLVIYGDVGLGKTHLIQAIGNHALTNGKAKRVMYVTSEIFTLEFVEAIQTDKTNDFSNFYRSMDILIVDDIQFFRDKEKTQDHFFHTFNTLHQLGKQIVLSSDRTPKELKGLNDRLISRFQSGLTADIQAPDLETRTAILRKKSLDNGIELRQDVVEFLALNVTSNIRELEGCLISLLAHASIRNKDVDVDLAKEVVHSIVGELKNQISIENIQRTVCEFYNIQEDLIRAKTRKQEVVTARQLAMYLSKELTNFSLKTIGLHFGGRDHSTVIHACQTVEDMMKDDTKYNDVVQHLKIKMNNRGR